MGDVLWTAQKCLMSFKYIGFSIVRTIDSRAYCRRVLRYNNIIEKDDNTLLSFFSFLTEKKATTFFALTPLEKKAMATSYRHLFR
jgi:hypothetical protein